MKYTSFPSRRIATNVSIDWYHGTASSASLPMMKSGVVTRGSQKSGEFSMYWFGDSQIDLPMRLWVFSYWNARATPEPHRMPPYAENMFTTGAPAMAAANICDCVMM